MDKNIMKFDDTEIGKYKIQYKNSYLDRQYRELINQKYFTRSVLLKIILKN